MKQRHPPHVIYPLEWGVTGYLLCYIYQYAGLKVHYHVLIENQETQEKMFGNENGSVYREGLKATAYHPDNRLRLNFHQKTLQHTLKLQLRSLRSRPQHLQQRLQADEVELEAVMGND